MLMNKLSEKGLFLALQSQIDLEIQATDALTMPLLSVGTKNYKGSMVQREVKASDAKKTVSLRVSYYQKMPNPRPILQVQDELFSPKVN